MSKLDFSDLIISDSRLYDSENDPLGLIAYQRHKRRRGVIGEESVILDEQLTPQQRIKRKQIMRRLAPKLARARKVALRTHGGNDVLKRRAIALARSSMAKKLLGGRSKADVSSGEKARVEKILASRKKSIERLSVKLLPIVRKKQQARFDHSAAKTQAVSRKPISQHKETEQKPVNK